MIGAVYRGGIIQPLDELPLDWREGQELIINSLDNDAPPVSFEEWAAELNAAASEISDEDHARMEAALEEIEARSKELGRREQERSQHVFADEPDKKPRQAG